MIDGKMNFHNKFEFEVVDAITGEVRQRAEAYNIVLDGMYTRILAQSPIFTTIRMGSGTGTLATSRTTLFNQIFSATASQHALDLTGDTVGSVTRKITLSPSDLVGQTITEVGIGSDVNTTLLTHALLQDSEGRPTTITKTATDIITVYATLYVELGAINSVYGDSLQWVKPLANNHAVLALLNVNGFSSLGGGYLMVSDRGIPASGVVSQGTSDVNHVATRVADTPTKKITYNASRFQVDDANFPIRTIFLCLDTAYTGGIFVATLPIPGVFENYAIAAETLGTGDGVNKRFSVAFDRFVDGSLSLKVGGSALAATEYTVAPKRSALYKERADRSDIKYRYLSDISPNGYFISGMPTHFDVCHIDTAGNVTVVKTISIPTATGDIYPTFSADFGLIILKASGTDSAYGLFVYDFDDLTGTVGQRYTLATTAASSLTTLIGSTSIVPSKLRGKCFNNWAIFYTTSGVNKIVSMYINRTNKTIGEQMNAIAVYDGFSIEVHSDYLLIGHSGTIDYIPFDTVSGIFGTKVPITCSIYYQHFSLSPDEGHLVVWQTNGTIYVYTFNKATKAVTLVDSMYTGNSLQPEYVQWITNAVIGININSPAIIFQLLPTNKLYKFTSAYNRTYDHALTYEITPGDYHILSTSMDGDSLRQYRLNVNDAVNINLNNPLASGVVLTADYTVPCIPKNNKFILDISASITLG